MFGFFCDDIMLSLQSFLYPVIVMVNWIENKGNYSKQKLLNGPVVFLVLYEKSTEL